MNIRIFIRNSFKTEEYHKAAEIRLVHSGNDYFETLENLILSAKHTLHLQTYIFDEDETGKRIAKALIVASERGVQIYMILDGYGSKSLSRKFVKTLRVSGIHMRFFSPLFSSQNIYFGRRLHHKVVVADQNIALVGGINIADKYHGSAAEIAWLDYAVLIKGSICQTIINICTQVYGRRFIRKQKKVKKIPKQIQLHEPFFVRIRENDRLRRKNQISVSYLQAIQKAKKSIYITGSYFLPGTRLRKALIRAAKRGVEVHLIMAGVSDVPVFQTATRWLYDLLFRNGIKIYEWEKSVLHGKVAVIDDKWTTIGSFNLNHLSAYGSIELNIDILDQQFSDSFQLHLKSVIETGCKQVFPIHQNNHWTAKLKRWAAYQITRTSIKIVALFPYINPLKKFN
ncbi:MAG: cardiolipin synthase ClsB [Bacteroidetes bacterium]|nr:cardiolipin synthase ClsB [Bacteroidota bacterium]